MVKKVQGSTGSKKWRKNDETNCKNAVKSGKILNKMVCTKWLKVVKW
jgi:hypothetical protein